MSVAAWSRAALRVIDTHTGDSGSCFVIDAEKGLLWSCAHVMRKSGNPMTKIGELYYIGMHPQEGQEVLSLIHI